jgi:hypothetical protein
MRNRAKNSHYFNELYDDGKEEDTPRGKKILKHHKSLTIRRHVWLAFSIILTILTISGTFMTDTDYPEGDGGCALKVWNNDSDCDCRCIYVYKDFMFFYGFFNLLPLGAMQWIYKAYVKETVTVRRYMKRAYRRIMIFFYPVLMATYIILLSLFIRSEQL